MRAPTAGRQLREKMQAALTATGIAGAEFDEYETEALEAACAAADRGEQLQGIYNRELRNNGNPNTLARLSGEIRNCERQRLQFLDRVKLTPDAPKSARHRRAANARWQRRNRANAPGPVEGVS